MRTGLPPASFFGMPVGVLGLGLTWRAAERLWPLPPAATETILGVGVLFWCALAMLYAAKWVVARDEARAELDHPVQRCFIGLGPAGASLAALAVMPYTRPLAAALFAAGAAGTLGFALYRTGRLWRGGREVEATTAVLYLPAVAGSFVTAIGASQFGLRDWGQLSFGAGAFSWLAIESVLLHRLYTGPELPVALRPTLGIQLAPPAVGALAYVSVGPGTPDMLAQALIGYALLQALVLARLARWIAAGPFTATYWAFSFGAVAFAGACVRLAAAGASVERAFAAPVFVLANAVIASLVAGTLWLLTTGQLLPGRTPALGSKR